MPRAYSGTIRRRITPRLMRKTAAWGSTSPVLLGGDALAQGRKDGLIRMLGMAAIRGADPHTGSEL